VDTLVQNYILMPEQYKDCYLTYLLNEFSGNSIIVFAIQCTTAQRVALMLRKLGFDAVPLHGKLSQTKRLAALNKFKAGQRKILVATDVASRGLDIPEVDLVINYELPKHPKDYIHRVGRTARAGNSGRAINMVTQYDVEDYQRIEEHVGKKLEAYPTEEATVLVFMERVADAQRLAAAVRYYLLV
jgi:ATP-dependent RNA helicase DDX47/RRP3